MIGLLLHLCDNLTVESRFNVFSTDLNESLLFYVKISYCTNALKTVMERTIFIAIIKTVKSVVILKFLELKILNRVI